MSKTPKSGGTKMKVVILGPNGVGKSALALRFAKSDFSDNYEPTLEEE